MIYDAEVINRVIRAQQGDIALAFRILRAEDMFKTWTQFRDTVRKDLALNALWGQLFENYNDKGEAKSTLLVPVNDDDKERRVEVSNASTVMRQMGLDDKELALFTNSSNLAHNHFKETLSIAHGTSIKNLSTILARIEQIREDYLDNDEKVPVLNKKGELILLSAEGEPPRYLMEDKIGPEEKMAWQAQYTQLLDQARRIQEAVYKGADVILKYQPKDPKQPRRKVL